MRKSPLKKTHRQNIRKSEDVSSSGIKALMPGFKLITVIVGLSLLLATSGYYITVSLNQFMHKPIAHVKVEGDFNYLTKAMITDLIAQEIKSSFVSENLRKMQQELNANPWIDSVELRRQWPDTLLVSVVEQRPIARWGNQGFVNYRGELVAVSEQKKLDSLPLLLGEDGQSFVVMKQYQLLSQLLAQYRISIRELEKNSLGVWTLYLDNGWTLMSGRTDVLKKTQRFMKLIATNKVERPEDIKVVDMRYQNGLAVQWNSTNQLAVVSGN